MTGTLVRPDNGAREARDVLVDQIRAVLVSGHRCAGMKQMEMRADVATGNEDGIDWRRKIEPTSLSV